MTFLSDRFIITDSTIDYKNSFSKTTAKDSVYFTGIDPIFGNFLAIVYKSKPSADSLSAIIIGNHGINESVDMTISPVSRYYGACLNLPQPLSDSLVRKALAIACLRTFSNIDPVIKSYILNRPEVSAIPFDWNETAAGALAASMVPAVGKFPHEIGATIIDSGVLSPKLIKAVVVDIVYEDLELTNDANNELVYLFGSQLEHLFDPLAEYSPEPTELLYSPPPFNPSSSSQLLQQKLRKGDNHTVQSVCDELFNLQSHFTSDLVGFLQNYLIPLRVKALSGDFPDLTTRHLNTIFPPTIDEVVRVNTIFFEALEAALPFGSFEIMKACGISVPYFYKACMRHEAATRNFIQTVHQNYDLLTTYAPLEGLYTLHRLESIIHFSLHLTKIKLVLDRLVRLVQWSPEELPSIHEFYSSAVGTIDSFGRESSISPYDNRIFTSTGKLLVELSHGWPQELEYGWINRRVVTIFDVQDLLGGPSDAHNIVFIFTDAVVVIRPTHSVPMTSDSGIHRPSIADMLLNSMINSMPLTNVPELEVVGWAPVEEVYFSTFGSPQNLAMNIVGKGLRSGVISKSIKRPASMLQMNPAHHCESSIHSSSFVYQKLFKLIRPGMDSDTVMHLLSKAKIMNKTQPFHLFQSISSHNNLTTYATVHEYNSYRLEARKCPIGLFMNMKVSAALLDNYRLVACIGIQVYDDNFLQLKVISTDSLGYSSKKLIHKEQLARKIANHVTHIYNILFSSSNADATEMVFENNRQIAQYLVKFATTERKESKSQHQITVEKRLSTKGKLIKTSLTPVPQSPAIGSESPVPNVSDTLNSSKIVSSQFERGEPKRTSLRKRVSASSILSRLTYRSHELLRSSYVSSSNVSSATASISDSLTVSPRESTDFVALNDDSSVGKAIDADEESVIKLSNDIKKVTKKPGKVEKSGNFSYPKRKPSFNFLRRGTSLISPKNQTSPHFENPLSTFSSANSKSSSFNATETLSTNLENTDIMSHYSLSTTATEPCSTRSSSPSQHQHLQPASVLRKKSFLVPSSPAIPEEPNSYEQQPHHKPVSDTSSGTPAETNDNSTTNRRSSPISSNKFSSYHSHRSRPASGSNIPNKSVLLSSLSETNPISVSGSLQSHQPSHFSTLSTVSEAETQPSTGTKSQTSQFKTSPQQLFETTTNSPSFANIGNTSLNKNGLVNTSFISRSIPDIASVVPSADNRVAEDSKHSDSLTRSMSAKYPEPVVLFPKISNPHDSVISYGSEYSNDATEIKAVDNDSEFNFEKEFGFNQNILEEEEEEEEEKNQLVDDFVHIYDKGCFVGPVAVGADMNIFSELDFTDFSITNSEIDDDDQTLSIKKFDNDNLNKMLIKNRQVQQTNHSPNATTNNKYIQDRFGLSEHLDSNKPTSTITNENGNTDTSFSSQSMNALEFPIAAEKSNSHSDSFNSELISPSSLQFASRHTSPSFVTIDDSERNSQLVSPTESYRNNSYILNSQRQVPSNGHTRNTHNGTGYFFHSHTTSAVSNSTCSTSSSNSRANNSVREWFNEIQRENLDNASLDSLEMDSVPGIVSNETTFDDTSISEVADFDQLQRYGSSNRVSNRSRNMRSRYGNPRNVGDFGESDGSSFENLTGFLDQSVGPVEMVPNTNLVPSSSGSELFGSNVAISVQPNGFYYSTSDGIVDTNSPTISLRHHRSYANSLGTSSISGHRLDSLETPSHHTLQSLHKQKSMPDSFILTTNNGKADSTGKFDNSGAQGSEGETPKIEAIENNHGVFPSQFRYNAPSISGSTEFLQKFNDNALQDTRNSVVTITQNSYSGPTSFISLDDSRGATETSQSASMNEDNADTNTLSKAQLVSSVRRLSSIKNNNALPRSVSVLSACLAEDFSYLANLIEEDDSNNNNEFLGTATNSPKLDDEVNSVLNEVKKTDSNNSESIDEETSLDKNMDLDLFTGDTSLLQNFLSNGFSDNLVENSSQSSLQPITRDHDVTKNDMSSASLETLSVGQFNNIQNDQDYCPTVEFDGIDSSSIKQSTVLSIKKSNTTLTTGDIKNSNTRNAPVFDNGRTSFDKHSSLSVGNDVVHSSSTPPISRVLISNQTTQGLETKKQNEIGQEDVNKSLGAPLNSSSARTSYIESPESLPLKFPNNNNRTGPLSAVRTSIFGKLSFSEKLEQLAKLSENTNWSVFKTHGNTNYTVFPDNSFSSEMPLPSPLEHNVVADLSKHTSVSLNIPQSAASLNPSPSSGLFSEHLHHLQQQQLNNDLYEEENDSFVSIVQAGSVAVQSRRFSSSGKHGMAGKIPLIPRRASRDLLTLKSQNKKNVYSDIQKQEKKGFFNRSSSILQQRIYHQQQQAELAKDFEILKMSSVTPSLGSGDGSFAGGYENFDASNDNGSHSQDIPNIDLVRPRFVNPTTTKNKYRDFILSSVGGVNNMSPNEIHLRALMTSIESLINEEFASVMAIDTFQKRLSSVSSTSSINTTTLEHTFAGLSNSIKSSNQQINAAVVAAKQSPFSLAERKQNLAQLEHINDTVYKLFEKTKGLKPLRGTLNAQHQQRVVNVENTNRLVIMSCAWWLISTQDSYRKQYINSTRNSAQSAVSDASENSHNSQASASTGLSGFSSTVTGTSATSTIPSSQLSNLQSFMSPNNSSNDQYPNPSKSSWGFGQLKSAIFSTDTSPNKSPHTGLSSGRDLAVTSHFAEDPINHNLEMYKKYSAIVSNFFKLEWVRRSEMVEKLESTASSASTTGSYSLESISLSGNMTGNRPGKESHNTLTQSHPGMAIDYVCHGTTGPKNKLPKGLWSVSSVG